MFRVILVPFFIAALMIPVIPFGSLFALVIFALASITDMLDGKVARKYNMITDLGKFLDPLADKILVAAALICFIELGWAPAWAVWLIMAREFMVSGVRLAAANSRQKLVIAANIWGKLKTAFTMVAIVASLFWLSLCYDFDFGIACGIRDTVDNIVIPVLIWISTLLTIISGAIYLKGYWHLIDSDK